MIRFIGSYTVTIRSLTFIHLLCGNLFKSYPSRNVPAFIGQNFHCHTLLYTRIGLEEIHIHRHHIEMAVHRALFQHGYEIRIGCLYIYPGIECHVLGIRTYILYAFYSDIVLVLLVAHDFEIVRMVRTKVQSIFGIIHPAVVCDVCTAETESHGVVLISKLRFIALFHIVRDIFRILIRRIGRLLNILECIERETYLSVLVTDGLDGRLPRIILLAQYGQVCLCSFLLEICRRRSIKDLAFLDRK